MNRFFALSLAGIFCAQFLSSSAEAQLRRPGIITVKHEDRNKTKLLPEKGAIYLEGMVSREIKVRVHKAGPAYSNLSAQRWLGNVQANQNAVLLAVSDKAYRIRARAQQGQIAGWVSKSIVSGLPEGFEDKLVAFSLRYELVRQLIENKQVALGMTPEEVVASLGPPDTKASHLDAKGRKDTFEFISYKRTPQNVVGTDGFGQAVVGTRYIEVESGRVTIEFDNNLVTAITETEGINLNQGAPCTQVPAFLPLF